jgi:hypothetical protein
MIRKAILLFLLPSLALGDAAAATSCANDALSRAKPLLKLHYFSEDDRITIEDTAEELPSIANPANPKQRLKVYEVWGYIYKGQYRMRFIYHVLEGSGCTLMGQEILEYARL